MAVWLGKPIQSGGGVAFKTQMHDGVHIAVLVSVCDPLLCLVALVSIQDANRLIQLD